MTFNQGYLDGIVIDLFKIPSIPYPDSYRDPDQTLRYYFLYHLSRHIRQPEWPSLEGIGELFMIES
mgnify:CR=1 FL=1